MVVNSDIWAGCVGMTDKPHLKTEETPNTLTILIDGLASLLSRLVERYRKTNIRDDTMEDALLEKYVLPAFSKSYPLSGFQHFIGTGLLAATITESLGYDYKLVYASYLGGVIHDYEKTGKKYGFAGLPDHMKKELLKHHLLNILNEAAKTVEIPYIDQEEIEEITGYAIRIGRASEAREHHSITELILGDIVRISDYITGDMYLWNPSAVINKFKSAKGTTLETHKQISITEIGVSAPRYMVISAGERILGQIEDAKPLVLTPTGIVLMMQSKGTEINIAEAVRKTAEKLAEELTAESTIPSTPEAIRKLVDSLVKYGATDKERVKNIMSRVTALPPVLDVDMLKIQYKMLSTESKRRFVMGFALALSKLINLRKPSKALKKLTKEIFNKELDVTGLAKYIENLPDPDTYFERLVVVYNEKQKEYMSKAPTIAEFLADMLNRHLSYPGKPLSGRIQETVRGRKCALCRAPIPANIEAYIFKSYVELYKNNLKALKIKQEIFHPDMPGHLRGYKVIEDVASLPVCPACYYEALVCTRKNVSDGMWATVLYYTPAIPYALYEVVKRTLNYVLGEATERIMVIPDYLTARFVIMEGGRNEISPVILRYSVALWYVLGGNVAITKYPFSSPTIEPGIYTFEVSDPVIVNIIESARRLLEEASSTSSYTEMGIHQLRYAIYKQLLMYYMSVDVSKRGKLLGPASMVIPTHPALTVMAMYVFTREKSRR